MAGFAGLCSPFGLLIHENCQGNKIKEVKQKKTDIKEFTNIISLHYVAQHARALTIFMYEQSIVKAIKGGHSNLDKSRIRNSQYLLSVDNQDHLCFLYWYVTTKS